MISWLPWLGVVALLGAALLLCAAAAMRSLVAALIAFAASAASIALAASVFSGGGWVAGVIAITGVAILPTIWTGVVLLSARASPMRPSRQAWFAAGAATSLSALVLFAARGLPSTPWAATPPPQTLWMAVTLLAALVGAVALLSFDERSGA